MQRCDRGARCGRGGGESGDRAITRRAATRDADDNGGGGGGGVVGGGVRAPRVFISYAHDSTAHREAVRDLWIFLRAHGVDARIDRVAAEQRTDWTLWMEQQVAEADRILVVASPAYNSAPV